MCEKHGFCSVKNRWAAGLLASLVLFAPGCGIILPKYTTAIERVAANDFERGLIAAAEAACADQEALAATCTEGTDATETCGWSCGETEYFKISFAVTSEALDYYQGLMDRYNDFRVPPWEKPLYADLEYFATVTFYSKYSTLDLARYENVYVVDLALRFSTTCGPVCGYYMGAGREVIFDMNGNLIDIEGDRQNRVTES